MRKHDLTNKKTTTKTNTKTMIIKNTFRELLTIETFDQSGEETWPDQQKDNHKDKNKDNDNDKYI